MISLIIGHKGSGKTKRLVEMVNRAVESSKGNVVCVEKEPKLIYDVSHRARLIETDRFSLSGPDAFYGFLCGVCSGDHDITDMLIDGTLRIIGRDQEDIGRFFKNVGLLEKETGVAFVFTVSADKEELPETIFKFCKNI
ncbi:MAG TPA: hypothetical protein PL044_11730 [Clostridiales bacterium]|nr:hypothetical protein [Clostridiales bacterium]HQH63303.1 hypothetical protein [Clostridiales bacterium]HQK74428.1 hypothetical protein [Clostridiales bacterium]